MTNISTAFNISSRSDAPHNITPTDFRRPAMVLGTTGSGARILTETVVHGFLNFGWTGLFIDMLGAHAEMEVNGIEEACQISDVPFTKYGLEDATTVTALSPDELFGDQVTHIAVDSLKTHTVSQRIVSNVLENVIEALKQRATEASGWHPTKFVAISEAWMISDRAALKEILRLAPAANVAVLLTAQGPNCWNSSGSGQWTQIANDIDLVFLMRATSALDAELIKIVAPQIEATQARSLQLGQTLISRGHKLHDVPVHVRMVQLPAAPAPILAGSRR